MSRDRTILAIRNNVAWCDAVCRAHGQAGEFHDSAWVNRGRTPEFYPNVIATRDGKASMFHVEKLLGANLPGEWGVKDSYAALPLESLGFALILEGNWIWRAPTGPGPVCTRASEWQPVRDVRALQKWEQAWSQTSIVGERRTFQNDLLDEPGVLFLSHLSTNGVVGGLIANRTKGFEERGIEDVVGISNRFGSANTETGLLAGLAAVESRFPDLPLVGYESDRDLGLVERLGFDKLGRLRVWIRD
jgi:hypothetical protein